MDSVISMKTRRPIEEQEAKEAAQAQVDAFDLNDEQIEIISVLNEIALAVTNGTLNCISITAMNPVNRAIFTYSSIPVSKCTVADCFMLAGVMDAVKTDVLQIAGSSGFTYLKPEDIGERLTDPTTDPDGAA